MSELSEALGEVLDAHVGWQMHRGQMIEALERIVAERTRAAVEAVRAELEPPIDRVRRLHAQDDGILAPGEWCPVDGDVTPCRTMRALAGATGAQSVEQHAGGREGADDGQGGREAASE